MFSTVLFNFAMRVLKISLFDAWFSANIHLFPEPLRYLELIFSNVDSFAADEAKSP